MNWRAFRLNQIHLRVDDALRAEKRRTVPNPLEILRLKRLKLSIRERLIALALQPKRA
ncbi:MAG: hypothetical protein ACO1OD_06060 [Croceibacterium sp.]